MFIESQRRKEAELDAVFHALSDSSRRRILQILRQAGELRVGDIAAAFEMSLNAVSKHLKVLEKAGLLKREIRGREHWLTCEHSALAAAESYLSLVENFWTENLEMLAEHLEGDINSKTKKEENHD